MTEQNKYSPSYYVSKYQHWDLVIDTGMGYFDGQATLYVYRWRKKGGREDLQKGLHFINKMMELVENGHPEAWPQRQRVKLADLMRFSRENNLGDLEQEFVFCLAEGPAYGSLEHARELILRLLDEADNGRTEGAVPASDSNKHAER